MEFILLGWLVTWRGSQNIGEMPSLHLVLKNILKNYSIVIPTVEGTYEDEKELFYQKTGHTSGI